MKKRGTHHSNMKVKRDKPRSYSGGSYASGRGVFMMDRVSRGPVRGARGRRGSSVEGRGKEGRYASERIAVHGRSGHAGRASDGSGKSYGRNYGRGDGYSQGLHQREVYRDGVRDEVGERRSVREGRKKGKMVRVMSRKRDGSSVESRRGRSRDEKGNREVLRKSVRRHKERRSSSDEDELRWGERRSRGDRGVAKKLVGQYKVKRRQSFEVMVSSSEDESQRYVSRGRVKSRRVGRRLGREGVRDSEGESRRSRSREWRRGRRVSGDDTEEVSDGLDVAMARMSLRGHSRATRRRESGSVKSRSTSRGGRAGVKRECSGWDSPPQLRRMKRVGNEEEYNTWVDRRPKREKQALTYDGKTPWKDFLVHFEACKEYNGWSDKEATYQLFTCCQGSALAALSVNDVNPKEMCYEELVGLMSKEFGPRECSENYFQELSKREQKPGEGLYGLAQDIKRLTALAYPRTERKERDRIAREHFKNAIGDSELRKELFRSRPNTLEDAVQSALAVESFYRVERAKGRGRLAYSRAAETGQCSAEGVEKVEPGLEERIGVKIKEIERKMTDRVQREVARVERQVKDGSSTGRVGGRGLPAFSRVTAANQSPDRSVEDRVEEKMREVERKVSDKVEREVAKMARQVDGKRGQDVGSRRTERRPVTGGERSRITMSRREVCNNCRQPGHFMRHCPKAVCFRCREPGHMAYDCSHRDVVCNKCRMEGHIARYCRNSGNEHRSAPGPVGRPTTR